MTTQCNCRGGPGCCMRRGVPAPLPPDQIKPLPLSVGIEEGRGGARVPRGTKCLICGTYLDDHGRCSNDDHHYLYAAIARKAPPPPPPAPEGFGIPEIRRAPPGMRGAFRRFFDAMRMGGVR